MMQRIEVYDGCAVKHQMTEALPASEWLRVSPDRGGMPLKLDVSVAMQDLVAGEYRSSITVAVPEAANGPLTVPVVLYVVEPISAAGEGGTL
jgi:hypothetical protein